MLVIVTHIWQKLSNVERKVTLIVTNFWQLFSQIFGETACALPKFLSFPLNHNFFPTVASHLRQASVCCVWTWNPAWMKSVRS
jgi:hypothetical protein